MLAEVGLKLVFTAGGIQAFGQNVMALTVFPACLLEIVQGLEAMPGELSEERRAEIAKLKTVIARGAVCIERVARTIAAGTPVTIAGGFQ